MIILIFKKYCIQDFQCGLRFLDLTEYENVPFKAWKHF